jgi:hypothetical protein
MNPKAIPQVDCHVKQQPHADRSKFRKCGQNTIQKNGNIRMQWMKIDAATISVVNGTRHQVIKIDCHCQHHDQPRLSPAFLKEKDSN